MVTAKNVRRWLPSRAKKPRKNEGLDFVGSEAERKRFDELAEPLTDRLVAVAMHLVHDRARAEDLAQDTLFKAWRRFGHFTPGTNFRAWLFQILTYRFFNERRNKP